MNFWLVWFAVAVLFSIVFFTWDMPPAFLGSAGFAVFFLCRAFMEDES